MIETPDATYDRITAGTVIWETDGRHGCSDNVTYRESLHATYRGPYTLGKQYAWDALVSNTSGLIGSDPERGFDLTMPAGQAETGSYTTRDFASAPHAFDYQPHFAEWERDHRVHPNLLLPGRTALFHGARFECLHLGDDLLGTGGCCVQDWVGLDFATMEAHGSPVHDTTARRCAPPGDDGARQGLDERSRRPRRPRRPTRLRHPLEGRRLGDRDVGRW
jgi:hypothetical protein